MDQDLLCIMVVPPLTFQGLPRKSLSPRMLCSCSWIGCHACHTRRMVGPSGKWRGGQAERAWWRSCTAE